MLLKRIIGEYTQDKDGPMVICIGGVHGNEPAGVLALNKVFHELNNSNDQFFGRVLGVTGNLKALQQKRRFIKKDLNRNWKSEEVDRIKGTDIEKLRDAEDIEQKELIEIFESALNTTNPVYFIDLHTTTATGGVFSICPDVNLAHDLAYCLHVPAIVGVEEVLNGTTLNYFHGMGYPTLGFEAGQHDDTEAVDNMVAAVFLLLSAVGCIKDNDRKIAAYNDRLMEVASGLPKVLKFSYRYNVVDINKFKLLPGFKNFHKVDKGQLLGYDHGEEIRSKTSGLLLMPLYQKQGEDGFFIVEPLTQAELA